MWLLGRLPQEVFDIVLSFVKTAELATLACLSRSWWEYVCPKLWKEVHGVAQLLALVVGGNHYWVQAHGASRSRGDILRDVSAS